jgi:hypothetical protein
MWIMPSAPYSKTVVTGARRAGVPEAKLLRATGLSKSELRTVLAERKRLTDKQLAGIERATGLTGGQLAALAIEPKGGALKDLCDLWARAAGTQRRSRQRTASTP